MTDDDVDRMARAFVLDQWAEQAAARRDAAFAGLRRLAIAFLVGIVAGVAGGCTAWLVLR